eukprot:12159775-Alexandrium_andersonii.AAC.1
MQTFNGDLPSWRFGEVVLCAAPLLERETALKIFWDPNKLLGAAPRRGGGRQRDGVEPNPEAAAAVQREAQSCTYVIRNDMWWAFAKLVLLLQRVLDKFANWMEGCECHPDRAFQDENAEGNRLTKRRRRAHFMAESR